MQTETNRRFHQQKATPRKNMSFMRLFGKGKNTLAIARSLFFNGKNQAELPHWYTAGKIANDFRSRQTMIMIHVWMLHSRLLKEGTKGTMLQECMFDELWDDTCIRIRNAGINEIMVTKRLGEVQGYSFRSCLELDQAMTMASDDEKVEEIAGALWRGVYQRNNDIEPDHVLEMANYIRLEAASVQELPSDAILEGRVAFGSIDHLWAGASAKNKISRTGGVKKYVLAGAESSSGAGGDEGEWRTNLSSKGTVYYYHSKTRETTWTKPPGFVERG